MTGSMLAIGARAAALLGLVLAAAGCGGSATGSAARPVERLPDLLQRSPDGLTGRTVDTPSGPRFHVAFSSSVDNVGAGPLVVVGTRSGDARTMKADQLVRRADGTSRRVRDVGRLRYTRSPDHQHWHYLHFDRYGLRRADGKRVRPDRKTGFCLGDRYDSDLLRELPGEPPRPVWTQECGKNQPLLKTLRQGISVGYGDIYHPFLEGQYLDITGLPAGEYELVHHVNADRRLVESDYSNNAASIVVAISWPRGMRRPPAIRVVERCGHGRRCSLG